MPELYDYDNSTIEPVLFNDIEGFTDEEPQFDKVEKTVVKLLNAFMTMSARVHTRQSFAVPNNPRKLQSKPYYSSLYEFCSKLMARSTDPELYAQYVLETWPQRNSILPRERINPNRHDANRFVGIDCPSLTYLARKDIQEAFLEDLGVVQVGRLFPTRLQAQEEVMSAGEYKLIFLCSRLCLTKEEVLSDPFYLGELPMVFLDGSVDFWAQDSRLRESCGLSCEEYLRLRGEAVA